MAYQPSDAVGDQSLAVCSDGSLIIVHRCLAMDPRPGVSVSDAIMIPQRGEHKVNMIPVLQVHSVWLFEEKGFSPVVVLYTGNLYLFKLIPAIRLFPRHTEGKTIRAAFCRMSLCLWPWVTCLMITIGTGIVFNLCTAITTLYHIRKRPLLPVCLAEFSCFCQTYSLMPPKWVKPSHCSVMHFDNICVINAAPFSCSPRTETRSVSRDEITPAAVQPVRKTKTHSNVFQYRYMFYMCL